MTSKRKKVSGKSPARTRMIEVMAMKGLSPRRRRLPGARAERPEDPVDLDAVSLGQALMLVARLGGHLNRRNDGPPGHQTVWEGYARLVTGAQTIERIAENGEASALHPCLARKA